MNRIDCKGVVAINNQVDNKNSELAASKQALFESRDLLFQLVDLFPVPINIFDRDGTSVYVNRACCEAWNFSSPDEIEGIYNAKRDPVVNEIPVLKEFIHRVFRGEVLSVADMKVPFTELSNQYGFKITDGDVEALYQDISCFPIYNDSNQLAYVVAVFITRRAYQGRSDIARAKEYIENHYLEEFDLEKVARAVNLSTYHFSRLFKKHTNETPYSYYKNIKVDRIKEGLCNRDLSISEVFESCGADYNGSFARIFKEIVGMSPSKYRELMAKK